MRGLWLLYASCVAVCCGFALGYDDVGMALCNGALAVLCLVCFLLEDEL